MSTRQKFYGVALVCLLMSHVGFGAGQTNRSAALKLKEVSLGRLPKDMRLDAIRQNHTEGAYWQAVTEVGRRWFDRYAVSPDKQRVVMVDRQDGGWTAFIDGKAGRSYDAVFKPRFSPDSKRVAYSAERGVSRFMVVDGVEGKSYSRESEMHPIFSPNSQRVAFMGHQAGHVLMVIDGVEGKPYASFRTTEPPAVFSPDSKRIAYAAETPEKKWVMVVDGVESKPADKVGQPFFSPDSQHVIYEARRGRACFVVFDGVEGPAFEDVSVWVGPAGCFSPDSKRMAYLARAGLSQIVVTDGKPGVQHDHVEFDSLVFSPDSRFAYAAKTGRDAFVVVDGKPGPAYAGIEKMPVFSSDGKRLAYVASRKGKDFMVLDGVEGARYTYLSKPVFSPDSKHLAYAAFHGLTATVVLDGKEGRKHALGDIEASGLDIVFSPDSQRMAYRVEVLKEAERVVVDGRESKLYARVEFGSLSFSPDSKHVAYWASPFSGGWYIVVDKFTTPKYTRILESTQPVFDGPDSLHALAIRDDEILLLQIKIPPPEPFGSN